jgi:hypothetical protein
MDRDEIINHELGHGIIAFIFHGDYYNFDGIKLELAKKLNARDSAYTISKPVDDLSSKVDNDNHLAASIDGLLLLGGIAGLTIFPTNQKPNKSSNIDYKNIFDFRGSEGDCEIIERGNRPYGWYLKNEFNCNKDKIDVRNARLLNLLSNILVRQEILNAVSDLKQALKSKNELTIDDLGNALDSRFIAQIKTEIIDFIKTGLGKPILVD